MAKTDSDKLFLDDDEQPGFFGRIKNSGKGPLLLLVGLLLFLVVVYVPRPQCAPASHARS